MMHGHALRKGCLQVGGFCPSVGTVMVIHHGTIILQIGSFFFVIRVFHFLKTFYHSVHLVNFRILGTDYILCQTFEFTIFSGIFQITFGHIYS